MPFLKTHHFKETYSQRLDRISKINGLRRTLFSVPKDRYVGEWTDSVKGGKGSYLSRSNVIYDGDFHNNFRHGFGIQGNLNRHNRVDLVFRGFWKNGLHHNQGEKYYIDDSYYRGEWLKGKRHGYGQHWYADGSFYDGDWYKDKRHGKGMLVLCGGNRFEGEWVNDLKQGKGRFLHLTSGQMQEGIWESGVCVFSTLIDIPFRQTAEEPTSYPIRKNELLYPNELCEEMELRALAGYNKSCESLRESILNDAISMEK